MGISTTFPRIPSHRGTVAIDAEQVLPADQRRQVVEGVRVQVVPIVQDQDGTTLIGVCRWLSRLSMAPR